MMEITLDLMKIFNLKLHKKARS